MRGAVDLAALANAALEDDRLATPGPWRVSMSGYSVKSQDDNMPIVATIAQGAAAKLADIQRWWPNADFIVHARTREPILARGVVALTARVEALEGTLIELMDCVDESAGSFAVTSGLLARIDALLKGETDAE